MPPTVEAQSLKHWTTRKVFAFFWQGLGGGERGGSRVERNSCLILDLWVKKLKLSFGGDQVRTETSSLKFLLPCSTPSGPVLTHHLLTREDS